MQDEHPHVTPHPTLPINVEKLGQMRNTPVLTASVGILIQSFIHIIQNIVTRDFLYRVDNENRRPRLVFHYYTTEDIVIIDKIDRRKSII